MTHRGWRLPSGTNEKWGRSCAFLCIKGHMIECGMFLFVVLLFVHLFVFL